MGSGLRCSLLKSFSLNCAVILWKSRASKLTEASAEVNFSHIYFCSLLEPAWHRQAMNNAQLNRFLCNSLMVHLPSGGAIDSKFEVCVLQDNYPIPFSP